MEILLLLQEFRNGAGGYDGFSFLQVFYIVFLFPLCIKRLEKSMVPDASEV